MPPLNQGAGDSWVTNQMERPVPTRPPDAESCATCPAFADKFVAEAASFVQDRSQTSPEMQMQPVLRRDQRRLGQPNAGQRLGE